jgi:glutathione S-transferase
MSSEAGGAPLTMLTFAPMVDSECSRLLLAHYGLAYDERDHLLPRAAALTFLRGGYGRVPLVYGKGVQFTGPRPIANHYDRGAAPELRLVPADAVLAQRVEADWHTYNGQLALDTAVFAYHHLLPLRELMSGIFAAPLAADEATSVRSAYGEQEMLLRVLLRPTAERAERALARIRAIFTQTDERIDDGRLFLCGDRLTLGDLALASAAAPLVLPQGYGAKMPSAELMPSPLRRVVRELQARPTAAFVQRLYAEGFPKARVPV